mgnify:FL=1
MAYKDKATDAGYTVMGGFGKHRDHFRVMSCHNGHLRVVRGLPWRESAKEAQEELDSLAAKNGWEAW